jgi:hypothetical protein
MSCEIYGGQNGIGAGFSQSFIWLPLLMVIPSLLHAHLSAPPEMCEGQTKQHIIIPLVINLGASSLTWYFMDHRVRKSTKQI